MTQLHEILDTVELAKERDAGYVTIREHPEFHELAIANYTDKCAFERHWTDVTRITRGLIWNVETGEVLARPFPKFFNFDEKEAPRILDDQVLWHWGDKADGSLGIVYPTEDGLRMATRGSFASEQAALGSRLILEWGELDYDIMCDWIAEGYTPLFEIVGPSNRIVLRYDEDALIHLGYIHIATGAFLPPAGAEKRTMRDMLADLSRPNAEGWVVWLSNTKAVKIKQADYIELHRMVSNLTPKEVWRQMRAETFSKYVEQLPDELQELAEEWHEEVSVKFIDIWLGAAREYKRVEGETRKDKAMWIQENVRPEFRGLVFSLLDGKDIRDSIYRMIEPKGA